MSDFAGLVAGSLRETVLAVLPIAVLLVFFQLVVLRRPVARLGSCCWGSPWSFSGCPSSWPGWGRRCSRWGG
ncbi:MAG: hypothetical protein R2731_00325 [Nocardioides sp.]